MNANHSAHSRAIYLLGNENKTSITLKRYQNLVRQFSSHGDFLTYDSHADWLGCYESDSQRLSALRPLLVFRPRSVSILGPFIQECYQQHIPIRVRCGGTSLTGAAVVNPGGIILLTNGLNRILHYDSNKGIIQIEPGVTVSQLNHAVQSDGWEFPLEMATNGAAGLGSCLSSQSKGYHQGDRSLYSRVRSAAFIDGQGEIHEVPGYLLCGAEGVFGVITQLEIQLLRKPNMRLVLAGKLAWDVVLDKFDLLNRYQCLKSVYGVEDSIYFTVEGEKWRVDPTINALKELFSPVQIKESNEQKDCFQLIGKPSCMFLTSAMPIIHLLSGKSYLNELIGRFGLECQIRVDFLSSTLQILLTSMDDGFEFSRKLGCFMGLWVEFLEDCGGYPYYGEEDMQFLQALRQSFDPQNLFSQMAIKN